jgi:hypothetical protein
MTAVDLFGEPLAAREDQGSLFGEGKLEAPEQRLTPTPDEVRLRVVSVLDKARAADAMPWNEREARMWQRVFPNMVRWLPEPEAEQLRAEFERQIARLTAA